MSEGSERLQAAVELLLTEDAVELPGPSALDRLRTILACTEQLRAATLSAVRDLDSRELYALDAAGSARTWLRRQPGGEDGQVTLARRLAQRPAVTAALADARIGLRSATQLCTALEHVPTDLDDALVTAVVQDGIGRLLLEHTGGTPEDPTAAAAVLAQRAADTQLLTACCADTLAAPAARIEPAFVLLAQRLPAAQLACALRLLLDPLQPDGTDTPDHDPYYLELRTLADGDVDLRGLLDPETGQHLATEIERRLQAARAAAAAAARTRRTTDTTDQQDLDPSTDDMTDPTAAEHAEAGVGRDDDPLPLWDHAPDDTDIDDDTHDAGHEAARDEAGRSAAATDEHTGTPADTPQAHAQDDDAANDPLLWWDQAGADADARAARRAAQPDGDLGRADRGPDAPLRLVTAGRQRHDALRDLLVDASTASPGASPSVRLTIVASLDAVVDRLGALPSQLVTPGGRSTVLRPETLQRLGCSSELDAVLLDAMGNPVGASSTRRMPNRRERRALQAKWGSTCAIDGCSHTRTVPHHVIPWWLSHLTRLTDLVPLCASCHHDLHEGHRTLRLRDQRLIDDTGWVTLATTAAA